MLLIPFFKRDQENVTFIILHVLMTNDYTSYVHHSPDVLWALWNYVVRSYNMNNMKHELRQFNLQTLFEKESDKINGHFTTVFGQLYDYLSQNWSSDGQFGVLYESKS